jgi:hypothetical protein
MPHEEPCASCVAQGRRRTKTGGLQWHR